jgi:hypothetical protein
MHLIFPAKKSRYFLFSVAGLIGVILIFSCAPPPSPPPPVETIPQEPRCIPFDLQLDSVGNHYARIAWNPGCPEIRILRGFNIYLSDTPLTKKYSGPDLPASIIPYNKVPFPGDTLGNPDRESFELKEIENSKTFYIHVRVIYTDESLSAPTNEIQVIVYPRGEFTLTESFSGRHDGFDFAAGDYCRTDDLRNDVYIYSKEGVDYLCSPSRLSAVNRKTDIFNAGEGGPLNQRVDLLPSGSAQERVSIHSGALYQLITQDGATVALRVKNFEGAGRQRTVTFEYIFKK